MKRTVSVIGAVICLSVKTMVGQTAGGDKDKHGCRASAGYIYSVIKNDCIRVFEQEIKLDEVNPEGTSTSISAVIFNADKTKAEVFMPGAKGGVVLLRKGTEGNYNWKKGKLSLIDKGKEGFILSKGKKVVFKSAPATSTES